MIKLRNNETAGAGFLSNVTVDGLEKPVWANY
jgi:twitching motility protein PilU